MPRDSDFEKHDELANDVYQTMAFAETQDLSTTRNKEILL
jgi:hypothetical protein